MKKFVALLLAVAMLFSCLPAGAEEASADAPNLYMPWFTEITSFETETFPAYIVKPDNTMDIPLSFINGERQIPYISAHAACDLLVKMNDNDFRLTVSYEAGYCLLTRETGAVCMLDPESDSICYISGDSFNVCPNAATSLDLLETGKSELNKNLLIATKIMDSENVSYSIELGDYGIDMIMYDGELYLPLQTVFDFFVSIISKSYVGYYTGKCVIIGSSSGLTNIVEAFQRAASGLTKSVAETSGEPADAETGSAAQDEAADTGANESVTTSPLVRLLMDAEPGPKSDALVQFNFSELCCALDYMYGLKDKHGIDTFKDTFIQYGLMDYLWSNDPKDTFLMFSKLAAGVFADGHSQVTVCSPFSESELTFDDIGTIFGSALITAVKMSKYQQVRNGIMGAEVPGYVEVGNTAYITFDLFAMDAETDYYTAELKNDTSDTLILLMYANEQLHRENCPIENVVIDLSNNGGGAADAAACVISFFLGGCNLCITNNITGAKAITNYTFDANRDGEYSIEEDSVAHLNRYCITGSGSFSCGNLVPAAFKASDNVTLIGRTTGGGACAVFGLSSADGNGMTISGPYCINTVVNGTFYDVDAGVIPDIYCANLKNLYDREYLTAYINGLL